MSRLEPGTSGRQREELELAEEFYRKALALCERLARNEGDAQAQQDLAVSLSRMAGWMSEAGRVRQAAPFLSRLRSVCSGLPGDVREPFDEFIAALSASIPSRGPSSEPGTGG